jgi:glycosyltransferase involved in cell wall biosynthesis
LKILSILNVSNADDLECDSGVIYQRLIAGALRDRGLDYVVVGPDLPSFEHIPLGGARKVLVDLGTTRFRSRFGFDWESFRAILEREAPDVVYCNQIELAGPLKALLVTVGAGATRLVTYCHFPAVRSVSDHSPVIEPSLDIGGVGRAILLQVLAALSCSDAVITQSEFARTLLVGSAAYHRVASCPIHVIPPPADEVLLAPPREVAPASRRLFYNHRLYASYGAERLYAWLVDWSSSLEFRAVISDPMPNRSPARQQLSPSPARLRDALSRLPCVELFGQGNQRAAYRDAINECRIGLAAPREACVWSMAAIDCMGLGVPVIAPRYAAYPELIPPALTFASDAEAKALVERLLDDDAFWLRASNACSAVAASLVPERVVARLFPVLLGHTGSPDRVDVTCAAS